MPVTVGVRTAPQAIASTSMPANPAHASPIRSLYNSRRRRRLPHESIRERRKQTQTRPEKVSRCHFEGSTRGGPIRSYAAKRRPGRKHARRNCERHRQSDRATAMIRNTTMIAGDDYQTRVGKGKVGEEKIADLLRTLFGLEIENSTLHEDRFEKID